MLVVFLSLGADCSVKCQLFSVAAYLLYCLLCIADIIQRILAPDGQQVSVPPPCCSPGALNSCHRWGKPRQLADLLAHPMAPEVKSLLSFPQPHTGGFCLAVQCHVSPSRAGGSSSLDGELPGLERAGGTCFPWALSKPCPVGLGGPTVVPALW